MRRLVVISLEFSAATFSGNGIYARSQVRSLCKQQCEVLVISGKPSGYTAPEQTEGSQQLIQVEVPVWDRLDRSSGWAELAAQVATPAVMQQVVNFGPAAVLGVDWSSLPAFNALAAVLQAKGFHVPPYIYMNYRIYLRTCLSEDEEFMRSMESAAVATAAASVALSRSDADFIRSQLLSPQKHAASVTVLLPALRSDMAALPLPWDMHSQQSKPNAIGNVSAAGSMPSGHASEPQVAQDSGQPSASAAAAPAKSDESSASTADASAAAKAVDESPMKSLIKQTSVGTRISPSIGRRTTPFSTSNVSDSPKTALGESDFVRALENHHVSADLFQQGSASGGGPSHDCQYRPFLTCCVRLSPEKEPHRFVELVEELASQGSLQKLGITPVMCASAKTPYALQLVARLQACAPNCVVHTEFLGPEQLATIYSKTRLNIHPCLYDAYGMTIVEAASQGAPSVVNGGGAVGATDLLKTPEEVYELDLAVPMPQLAHQVAQLWQDAAGLAEVGQAAARKARSWTESANAAVLLSLVEDTLRPSTSFPSFVGA